MAVMNNPEFPFQPEVDSYQWRWFIIATNDYEAPASRDSLDKIVNLICKEMKYNDEQKNKIYTIYFKEIHEINKVEHKEIFISTINDISGAREGLEARKIWDLYVNLPFKGGPGTLYAKAWPTTVNPDRTYSRIKSRPIPNTQLKTSQLIRT